MTEQVSVYADNSQMIAVLEGFVRLMLEASEAAEAILGKPLAFNDRGFYQDSEIGITVMTSADKPDLAVTVSTYIANPNAGPGLTEYAVQIRARSATRDYRPAAMLLELFREHDAGPRLNGRTHSDLGGYNATIIMATSLGDMGLDRNDRYELTENYYVIVNDEPGVMPAPPWQH